MFRRLGRVAARAAADKGLSLDGCLLLANVLLLSGELALPFYAVHAATLHDPAAQNVTLFVLTNSVCVLLSGFWAKVPTRHRIAAGALLAALARTMTFVFEATGPWQVPYFCAAFFILLTWDEEGSIQGRLTYLANRPPEHDRPALVATSSTAGWIAGIGVTALLAMAGNLQIALTATRPCRRESGRRRSGRGDAPGAAAPRRRRSRGRWGSACGSGSRSADGWRSAGRPRAGCAP